MSEYYYNQTDRVRNKRRSLSGIILDGIALLLSVVAFAAMALTLITSYYDPSKSWIFPVVGLVTPAIYVATMLLALYWIIRWRWIFASLLILPLAIGAPSISYYAKLETAKEYEKPRTRGALRLMSYNAKGFMDDDGQNSVVKTNEFLEQVRPDVICFQEFVVNRMKPSEESKLLKSYDRVIIKELATYSRYKILDSSENLIDPNFQSGMAFWSDILIGSDTVRLFNIHLHSTQITTTDNKYISNMEFIHDTLSDDIFKGMISRFRNTAIGRAAQADAIAELIAQSPHRVIVCGDFNDTPNSYAFRKISNGFKDTFKEMGVGYPHTFRGFMNLLRIDYILVDKPTEVLSFEVLDTVKLSDHHPIITTIKL